MKIIFENIETSTLHNFKGGEKHLTAKMYVDKIFIVTKKAASDPQI